MKVLISGVNSGLGKYLSEVYQGCDQVTRDVGPENFLTQEYDMVIHCAASVAHYSWDDEIPYQFLHDNIFLTNKMLDLKCEKFVYISSIDQKKDTPYGVAKRLSELLVKQKKQNHLILRPVALLGKYMRKNSFQKILKSLPIGLTADSVMNYVLYEDVLNIIKQNNNGTLTLRCKEDITLREVAALANSDTKFGNFKFVIENVDSDFSLNKTSKDSIIKFLELTNEAGNL
jgi:nucleoside-diphosphate-sugar epimerase